MRHSAAKSQVIVPKRKSPRKTALTSPAVRPRASAPWYLAIGASGVAGLANIQALLAALPHPLRAVILIVLHRSWNHESQLRAILAAEGRQTVVICEAEQQFAVGTVYIGEPSRHLTLGDDDRGVLVEDPMRNYRNRTVDLLFRSVAKRGKGRVIGVVLSGTLDDGSEGLALIRGARGTTMVIAPRAGQSGMPEHAIAFNGAIDLIGSVTEIATGIASVLRKKRSRADTTAGETNCDQTVI